MANPIKAINEYDKKFDRWFEAVRRIKKSNLNLPLFYESIKQFDPYGAHDSGLTPEEFAEEIK